jgi:antitoxin ParD1/3/4
MCQVGPGWRLMMIFDKNDHMSSINFSVPDDLREFVDERIASAGFSTPSEYMRHLIREDRKRAAQEQLEARLLEGIDSGASEPWTEADVEEVRAAVRERLKKRRGAHGNAPKR